MAGQAAGGRGGVPGPGTDRGHRSPAGAGTFVRAESLYWFLCRIDEAEAAVRATEAAITDKVARCELKGLRSCFYAFSGQMSEALETARGVLGSPDAGENGIAWAAAGATFAHGYTGRVPAAREVSRPGWTLWERDPERHRHAWIPLADTLFTALWHGGELDGAESVAEDFRRRGLSEYSPLHTSLGGMWLGYAALSRGLPATARRWLLEAPPTLNDFDPGGELHLAHLGLVQAHALLGDAPAAARSLAAARRARRSCSLFHLPYDPLAEAWLAMAEGQPPHAVRLAHRATESAAWMELPAVEALALHTALRFGGAAGPRLRELADAADSRLMNAYAAHSDALAAQDCAGLERAAAGFATLGMSLLAAEACTQAAAAHDAAGRRATALNTAGRARTLLASCEGARTPVIDGLRPATSLTRREREVAALAADGLTSKSIADRLSISVRTVESHLDRVYAKLGISSRTDLTKAWHHP